MGSEKEQGINDKSVAAVLLDKVERDRKQKWGVCSEKRVWKDMAFCRPSKLPAEVSQPSSNVRHALGDAEVDGSEEFWSGVAELGMVSIDGILKAVAVHEVI